MSTKEPSPILQNTLEPKTDWTNWFFVDFLAVFCLFFLYAGSAVPGVNEPHYWTKAAHFWDGSFGRGDLFLESGDAHWLFFATFGYLTQCLSLHWAVWIGRIITWLLLAMGWTLMARKLLFKPGEEESVGTPGIATLWALIWLVGMHWGHWAGEWVVGGCEAKGIAYACIFTGIAMAIDQRWTWCWTLLGMAAAYHVVSGVWLIACVLFVSWVLDCGSSCQLRRILPWIKKHRMGWILCAIGVIIGAIPTMRIDWGIEPALAAESAVKQVYTRLGHHLAPSKFNSFRWQSFGVQILVGVFLLRALSYSIWLMKAPYPPSIDQSQRSEQPLPRQRLNSLFSDLPRGLQVVLLCGLFAFGIALIGLMLDFGLASLNVTLASQILRFYWFRWNDVAMPMMLGALITAYAYGRLVYVPRPIPMKIVSLGAILGAGALLVGFSLSFNFNEVVPAGEKANLFTKQSLASEHPRQYREWLEVCQWIRLNTDSQGLWLTPRRQQSFKWQTGRPELVSWKDAPQNALAVLEWDQRLKDAFQYDADKKLLPWTTEQIWQLHSKYGIRYILLDRRVPGQTPPLLPVLYPGERDEVNGSFAVFEIPNQSMPRSGPNEK